MRRDEKRKRGSRRERRAGRPFSRALFGYRRTQVDQRLAQIDATIVELRAGVDAASSVEHHDLVQRATRRSVESVIEQAHAEAVRIRAEADAEAAGILADAYELVKARDHLIDLRADEEPTADPALAAEGDGDLFTAESDQA